MTFLNPLILWGLLAVAIPVIIHLLNLRRTKKIEFPTLMFLKEIQQTKYKKIKLKQLLILLCRAGLIISLVLAFANPILHGYLGSGGSKLRSTVILVIDDSFSMQALEGGKNKLETAKNKIQEIFSLFDDKDEVYFAATSGISLQKNPELLSSAEHFNKQISLIQPTAITANINDIIEKSIPIFKNSNNPNKEIFILTDGQRCIFDNRMIPADNPDMLKDIHINIILTGNHQPSNISIDTIDIKTKIFEKNKEVILKCLVNNRNNFNVTGKPLTLNFGGKTIDEKNIDIPANSILEVEFNIIPSSAFYRSGFIELTQSNLTDDEIKYDNRRYFTVYIPEEINILIVSANQSDNNFLKTLINTVNESFDDTVSVKSKYFEFEDAGTIITAEKLRNKKLIIINGKPNITKEESALIEKYLTSGGGLIIFPSADISIDNYNNFLSMLNLPLITGIQRENTNIEYNFSEIDYEHPIIQTIFKNITDAKNYPGSSPKIKSFITLQSGYSARAVIKLNSGNNFLVENNYGKGKILLYSVSPDMTFSDFPETNIFAPLITRSILYASANPILPEQVAGKDYYIEISPQVKQNMPVILEDKIKNISVDTILLNSNGEPIFLNLKNYINSSSQYDIKSQGIETIEFSANHDNKESDMTYYTEDEIKQLLIDKFAGINVIKINHNLTDKITEARTGTELWKLLLVIALFFIILEYIISRSMLITPKKTEINN